MHGIQLLETGGQDTWLWSRAELAVQTRLETLFGKDFSMGLRRHGMDRSSRLPQPNPSLLDPGSPAEGCDRGAFAPDVPVVLVASSPRSVDSIQVM